MKRAIQTARQGRCLHTTPVWRNSLPTITLEGVASRQSENPDSYVNSSSSPATPPIVQQDQEDIPELSEQELIKRRDVMNKRFESFGSAVIDRSYSPRQSLNNPPSISDVSLSLLIASQAQLGHSTSLWNPITQPFIYGIRDGIHILNLDITLAHLRRAAQVVRGVALQGGNILFVGTRDGQKRSVVEAAKRAGGYHVFKRWIPGTITNGKQVLGHGAVSGLITRHKLNTNASPASSKGKQDVNDGRPQRPNSAMPDLVVILNPLENRNLLKECAKGRVPTIGIIDTDADPRWVTYSIPANDDSLRCTTLIVGTLAKAAEEGRKESALKHADWITEELS